MDKDEDEIFFSRESDPERYDALDMRTPEDAFPKPSFKQWEARSEGDYSDYVEEMFCYDLAVAVSE